MYCPVPDENLRAAILVKFAAENRIASCNIRVGVLNGIVHLAGIVDSLAKRNTAEELARKVPGVRGIVNRIEAPGAPSPSRTINLDLSQDYKEARE
mgnify:CR=1 FL=1